MMPAPPVPLAPPGRAKAGKIAANAQGRVTIHGMEDDGSKLRSGTRVHCTVLGESVPEGLRRLLEGRGWSARCATDPVIAMVAIARHERTERARCGWGVDRRDASVLIVPEPRRDEQVESMCAALARYLPEVIVLACRNGELEPWREENARIGAVAAQDPARHDLDEHDEDQGEGHDEGHDQGHDPDSHDAVPEDRSGRPVNGKWNGTGVSEATDPNHSDNGDDGDDADHDGRTTPSRDELDMLLNFSAEESSP